MAPPRAFDFAGEVAIVTGAGSRMDGEISNGRSTAILLARQGTCVTLVNFNPDWAEETKRMIDEERGICEVTQADVTAEESCITAVARTIELFGTVNILVNIVGVGGAMRDATKLDIEARERDFRINVTSMMLMSRHVIPEMRKNARVTIVKMGSVSGCDQGHGGSAWTREHLSELRLLGNGVYSNGSGLWHDDEMRQARIIQNLLKQEGTGWDVGYGKLTWETTGREIDSLTNLAAILFLCSKEAKWITGLIMPVDGVTTAGKADRPALTADTLAEKNTGVPNSAT
ncbi:short-chain dehydrogenase reductase sdr [Seiridium cupressi]